MRKNHEVISTYQNMCKVRDLALMVTVKSGETVITKEKGTWNMNIGLGLKEN
jgi:hypothetical protein